MVVVLGHGSLSLSLLETKLEEFYILRVSGLDGKSFKKYIPIP
jgi:hypothetical protein